MQFTIDRLALVIIFGTPQAKIVKMVRAAKTKTNVKFTFRRKQFFASGINTVVIRAAPAITPDHKLLNPRFSASVKINKLTAYPRACPLFSH